MPDWIYQQQNYNITYELVVDDSGNVYFQDGDNIFKSVDSTGSLRWTTDIAAGAGAPAHSIAVNPDGGELLVFTESSIYFLDGSTGSVNSSSATSLTGFARGMVTVGNTREVYTVTDTELVHYDFDTDTTIDSFVPPNGDPSQDTTHLAVGNNGSIYFGDGAGYIYEVAESDFSEVQSKQIATFKVDVLAVSDDQSFLVATGYNFDTNTAYTWGYDGAFTEQYEKNFGSSSAPYHDGKVESLYPTSDNLDIQGVNENGIKTREYTDNVGDVENININEAYDPTKTIFTRGVGEVTQVDDSEFTTLVAEVSATQVSTAVTMNGATAARVEPISATQVSTPATMNTTSVVINPRVTATQATATATPNSTTTETIPRFIATQPAATATMPSADTTFRTGIWTIYTADGSQYHSKMELDDGVPQFRIGVELSRVFMFIFSEHTDTYNMIRSKYNERLTEDTIKVIQTVEGRPHYTQNINPLSEAQSFLWRLKDPSIDEDWWVVVTDINDVTRHAGPSESLEISMVPIAPYSEGNRTYIKETYEV